MTNRKKDESEELKEILGLKEEIVDEETASIIFDGRQYSIRIPMRFAKRMGIDTNNDKFKFTFILPPVSKANPELKGEYIRG